MSTPVEAARPVFTLTPVIPLDKEYLRELLRVATSHVTCIRAWGTVVRVLEDQGPTYLVDEKEWDAEMGRAGNDEASIRLRPPSHRVDLYCLQRGLHKVFEAKYHISLATRQIVLRSLFEQSARPCVFAVAPFALSEIVQLALFDQIVY